MTGSPSPLRVHRPAPGVTVFVSEPWCTTCTVADLGGGAALVVDSPVLPGEAGAVARAVTAMGLRAAALAVTHADWDHLLCPAAFPGVPVIVARDTAERLADEIDRIVAEAAEWHRLQGLPDPVLSASDNVLVVDPPRAVTVAGAVLRVHPAAGHTRDGVAFAVPRAGLLCVGDYLSPVEDPAVEAGGSVEAYRATLDRLAGPVGAARAVVPGHGHPLAPAEALAILECDRRALAPAPPAGDGPTGKLGGRDGPVTGGRG